VALSLVGKAVERGLFRSALSRSGIIGSDSLSALPLTARFDQLLDQRVNDATTVNYRGCIGVRLAAQRSVPDKPGSSSALVTTAPEVLVLEFQFGSDLDVDEWATTGDVLVRGGAEREYAIFNVSASAVDVVAVPSVLLMTVPVEGRSVIGHVVLQPVVSSDEPSSIFATRVPTRRRSIVVEVGQGGGTVQVVQLEIPPAGGVPLTADRA